MGLVHEKDREGQNQIRSTQGRGPRLLDNHELRGCEGWYRVSEPAR